MKETILSKVKLSEEIYELFENSGTKKKAKKGDLLFQPQKKVDKILFLETGILRGYTIVNGKDFTHHFFLKNWFATDFKSFLTKVKSSLFIETLTDVEYYEFHKKELLHLYKKHHQLESLGRIIAEKAFLLTVEKLTEIQTLDLKSRYKNLITKNKALFQKVPQKYIASYLGVSEQSLSRVKKNIIS